MGNDKMLFIMANDCSDEAPELEKLVFKFGNTESKKFQFNNLFHKF